MFNSSKKSLSFQKFLLLSSLLCSIIPVNIFGSSKKKVEVVKILGGIDKIFKKEPDLKKDKDDFPDLEGTYKSDANPKRAKATAKEMVEDYMPSTGEVRQVNEAYQSSFNKDFMKLVNSTAQQINQNASQNAPKNLAQSLFAQAVPNLFNRLNIKGTSTEIIGGGEADLMEDTMFANIDFAEYDSFLETVLKGLNDDKLYSSDSNVRSTYILNAPFIKGLWDPIANQVKELIKIAKKDDQEDLIQYIRNPELLVPKTGLGLEAQIQADEIALEIKGSEFFSYIKDTLPKIFVCAAIIDKTPNVVHSNPDATLEMQLKYSTCATRFFAYVFYKQELTYEKLLRASLVVKRVEAIINHHNKEVIELEKRKREDKYILKQRQLDLKFLQQEAEAKNLDVKIKAEAQLKQAQLDNNTAKQIAADNNASNQKIQEAQAKQQEKLQKEQQKFEAEQQKEDHKAAAQRAIMDRVQANQGAMQRLRELVLMVRSKETTLSLIMTAGGLTIAVVGLRKLIDWLTKSKPNIILYTTLPSGLWERIFGTKTMPPVLVKPVYNPKVQRRFDELFRTIQRTVALKRKSNSKKARKAVFTNIAFTGPPGTGKTFGAKVIAYLDGKPMKYVIIPAAALSQLRVEKAVQELNNIFKWINSHIKRTGEPVMVIWDEFDAIAGERSEGVSDKNLQLINMFLALVPKPNSEYFFHIFITNFKLDRAIQSRIGAHFEVDLPSDEEGPNGKKSALERLLFTYLHHAAEEYDLSLDSTFKDASMIRPLIKIMKEGEFTGRDIEQTTMREATKASIDDKSKLSYKDIERAIKDKYESRKDSMEASARRARGQYA